MDEIFEITSEDLTAHVMFEPEDLETLHYPCARGIVEVVSAGFVGVNRSVRFEAEDLLRFARELTTLLETGQGSASLTPMSPGSFQLLVHPHGKRGQIRVDVVMRKYGELYDDLEHTLSTGFLADRSSVQAAAVFLTRLARSLIKA